MKSHFRNNSSEALEAAKSGLLRDVADLRFDGVTVTGRHGLVSADLKTRKLFFYRVPGERPCCVLEIPAAGNAPALMKALTHPVLRGWDSLDGMQWPDGRIQYAFELWSCDDPVKVCIHEAYPTAEAAFVALADFFEDPEHRHSN